MTPHLEYSEDHEVGGCYRTCLAMILNVDPRVVPHFMEVHKDLSDLERHERINEWLAQYGLVIGGGMITVDDVAQIPETLHNVSPGAPALVSGRSVNGVNHSVVCFRGQIVNPSPSCPLASPFENGCYWVEFISVGHNFNLAKRLGAQNG